MWYMLRPSNADVCYAVDMSDAVKILTESSARYRLTGWISSPNMCLVSPCTRCEIKCGTLHGCDHALRSIYTHPHITHITHRPTENRVQRTRTRV